MVLTIVCSIYLIIVESLKGLKKLLLKKELVVVHSISCIGLIFSEELNMEKDLKGRGARHCLAQRKDGRYTHLCYLNGIESNLTLTRLRQST